MFLLAAVAAVLSVFGALGVPILANPDPTDRISARLRRASEVPTPLPRLPHAPPYAHGALLSETDSPTTLPCSFTLDSAGQASHYDLCPLLRGADTLRITSHEDTPPTRTEFTYTLGLGEAIKRDKTLPAELQCGEGTWVCLQVINSRPSHPSEPPRVLQVVPVAGEPGLRPTAKLVNRKVKEAEGEVAVLRVVLHGGRYTERSQKAVLDFICAEETTPPALSWTFNGTHAFEWRSQHACGKAAAPNNPSGEGGDQDLPKDGDGEPTPPPANDEGDEAPPADPEAPDSDAEAPATPSPAHPLLRVASVAAGVALLYFALRALLPRLRSAMLHRKARRATGLTPASRFAGLVPAQFVPSSLVRDRAGYEPLFDAGEAEEGQSARGAGQDYEGGGWDAAGAGRSGANAGRRAGQAPRFGEFESEASPLSATFAARGAYGTAR
ncbi:hypothetical protein HDZ31DRAFT_67012 [Schizophyllum fasciatum]